MNKEPAYVDIGEKNFRIRPFTAFDGGYAMLFVTKKLLPLVKALTGKDESEAVRKVLDTEVGNEKGVDVDAVLSAVMPLLDSIDRKELQEFMGLCLTQVDERFAAGYMALYKNGIFSDEEIEYSTSTCLRLCFEVVKPLVADFFAENGLNLSHAFKTIMNPSAQ